MTWLVLVESNTTGSGRLFCAAARRLGLRPLLLARDPLRYPYLVHDRIDTQRVDTADAGAVRSACSALDGPVAGVTSSSEYFIVTASEVARSLGLPYPDPDAIRACRDKATQRAALQAAGVPSARYAAATSPAAAVSAAGQIGLPVVVKPVAGSGSVATRLCRDLAAVAQAARTVLADSGLLPLPPQQAVLVEEYLPGPEYSVETFHDKVVGVTRKLLGPEPHFVEVGHDFPARLAPVQQAALGDTALAALRALGLGTGPAHVELRLVAGRPRVVEINPRLAGGMIPQLVFEATGIDLIQLTVAWAANRCGVLPAPTRRRAAAIRFLVAGASGRLVEVRGAARVRQLPGVVTVGLTRSPGDELRLQHSFRDRIGYVVAAGADPDEAAGTAAAGIRELNVEILPGVEVESR